ncbi:cytochrome P450 [Schizopora paradoxa]|uniref:Cytochrome P450 n=1 Tax=Schizopora paradoxa TaxID=27342 RepID=A0A0H2RDY7_9AGAM|nr:cytochrome P450 [Schizopora paradoxa]
MLDLPMALIEGTIVAVLILWFTRLRRRGATALPPGPRAYPLIGNVLDMMVPELWEEAQRWGKSFGDIIYLKGLGFGKPFVIINSYEAAVELLEKRSLNSADRPGQRWDWALVNMSYGEEFKKLRAPVQKFFDQSSVLHYEEVQRRSVRNCIRSILQTPEEYELHVRTAISTTIMMLTYGHEVKSSNDRYVSLARDGIRELVLAMRQGAYLVDIIPWLKYVPEWVPGAGFQQVASNGAKLSHDMRYLPYYNARDSFFSGTAVQSFTSEQIEERLGADGKLSKVDEDIISAATGIVYIGGVDTSVSAIMGFILAMVMFPEAQKRAQDELDRVIGGDHLPYVSDRERLPYCTALCKELLRWHVITPLAVPHAIREDDMCGGFRIPAGTTVYMNQWAMHMDPVEYPDPHVFRPERHLPAPGERLQRDPNKVTFGLGRRVCPGKQSAENTIFIMATHMLSVFNMSKSRRADGSIIEPNVRYTNEGIIHHIDQFECSFTPRSDSAVGLVTSTLE